MKILKITLIIIAVLLTAMVAVYAYYGGFRKIEIKFEQAGGETIVYEEMTGDYANTGKVIDKIYYALLNDSVETYKGIGIFYDNPKKVAKENLRYEAGCILGLEIHEKQGHKVFKLDLDSAKIETLKQKYKVKTIPVKKYLITEFPYKGKMSIIVGIIKVYPAFDKYLNYEYFIDDIDNIDDFVIEIYDVPNKKIIYRMVKVAEE